MQRSNIKLIIIVSTLALVGLILTQLFWVMKAVQLAEKQYNHRIDMAMEDVINEMMGTSDSVIISHTEITPGKTVTLKKTIFDAVDTTQMRHLLDKYTEYHQVGKNYEFAIIKTSNDSVIYSTVPEFKKLPLKKIHKACLSCLWKTEYFHLSVYFPSRIFGRLNCLGR